jgi:hypothetical protein
MKNCIKKWLTIFLSIALITSFLPMSISAEETTTQPVSDNSTVVENADGFKYTLESGSLTIVGYSGLLDSGNVLKIPEKISENLVTQIGKEAFTNVENIKEVQLPKSVNKIDLSAFDRCDSLEKISVSTENVSYYDINGKLFDKKSASLLFTPSKWSESSQSINTQVSALSVNSSETLTTFENIPTLSITENVDQQLIILYKENQSDNFSSLSLTTNDIVAANHLSEYVDVIQIKDPNSANDLIGKLSSLPNVQAVDKNEIIQLDSMPNDTHINQEWQFANVGADKTWNTVSNSSPIVVAVLDTGITANHPDLQGRITDGYDYIRNMKTTSSSAIDLMGHGTNVSGCIAAITNNSIGIAGVTGTANIKIAPYRVGGRDSYDRSISIAAATSALSDITHNHPEIRVVNMSFGGPNINSTFQSAISSAVNAGKILVAASGNEGEYGYSYSYPASYDGVISVGATNSNRYIAEFSTFNDKVDLCAPGVSIYTTSNDGSYEYNDGTSFASPITAGCCATLLAKSPSLSANQVETTLKNTALDLGSTGKDNYYGYGLVQLDKALSAIGGGVSSLKIDSFVSNKQSGQITKTPIQLSVAASGGTGPYKYKFYAISGSTTVSIKAYSSANNAIFTPTKPGSYTILVDVKDSKGNIVTGTIDNFNVFNSPKVSSFKADKKSGISANTPITFTAVGSDGLSPYQYKFYYKLGSSIVTIRDFESSNTTIFTPSLTGTYTFYCDVKDAHNMVTTGKISSFKIATPPTITSFQTSVPTGQFPFTNIKLTANVTGGKTPYKYKFSYNDGFTDTVIKDFSSSKTAYFRPTHSGNYTIRVELRDSGGAITSALITNYVIY